MLAEVLLALLSMHLCSCRCTLALIEALVLAEVLALVDALVFPADVLMLVD